LKEKVLAEFGQKKKVDGLFRKLYINQPVIFLLSYFSNNASSSKISGKLHKKKQWMRRSGI
jgi:hypothetical protein